MPSSLSAPSAAVVVPAYNAARHISSLLDALAAQTVPAEIVVIDDGSTDGTGDAARTWAVLHPTIQVRVLSQVNQGPAVARNLGARSCAGGIILFTDSDCIPQADWIAQMLAPFSAAGVAGVQGSYRSHQRELAARFAQIEIEERYDRMMRGDSIDFIGTYAAAYRRSVFLAEGGFDARFPMASGEDVEFSFRLAERGFRLVFQPSAIVSHRHPDTFAKYLRQKYWRAYWRNLIYRHHVKRMVRDSYTPNSLKVQTLLGLLFPPSLLGLLRPFPWPHLSGFILLAHLLSTVPCTLWVARRDPKLALMVPGIVLLRTGALAAGTAHGVLSGLWSRRKFAKERPISDRST